MITHKSDANSLSPLAKLGFQASPQSLQILCRKTLEKVAEAKVNGLGISSPGARRARHLLASTVAHIAL